jgi:LysM repeat protein
MGEIYDGPVDEFGIPIGFTDVKRNFIDKKKDNIYRGPVDEDGIPVGFVDVDEEPKEPLQEKSSFKPSVSTRLMLEAANFVAGGRSKEEYIDMARVGLSIPVGTSKLVYDIVDSAQSQFTEKEWGSDVFNNFVRKKALATGLDEEVVDVVLDPEGKIKKVDTTLGMGLEVGSWFLGYKGVKKLLGEGKTIFTEGLKKIGASAAASQVLSNPSYNTGNMIEEFLSDNENYNNGNIYAFAQALSAEEDDSIAMQRFKLLGEEPLFLGLGYGIGKSVSSVGFMATQSRKLFNKPVSELTPTERSKVTASILDDAKERIQLVSDKPLEIRVKNVEEEFQELPITTWEKTKSFLSPTIQKYFTAKGQFTQRGFDLARNAEIQQRQWLGRAEFIAANLQRSLDDVTAGTDSAEMSKKVMEALNSDTSFLKDFRTQAQKVKAFGEAFNLPKQLAEDTYASRKLIDELSGKFNNVTLPKAVQESIGGNIGAYLRRSYRKYEDPNYVRSPEVYNKALDYFTQLNKGDVGAARGQIESILGSEWKDSFSHFTNVSKLNKKILKQKKGDVELPKVVRELLGEIENPSEAIVISIAKASKLYENMKFYSTFENLGMKGNYVFTRDNVPLRGLTEADKAKDWKNFKEITGTNSDLDGKYTTIPMYNALMKREETFGWNKGIYGYFLAAKGLSQANKTVFSLTTNIRNISGGAQFGLANGLNPFTGTKDTMQTLWAGIHKKGNDAVVEKYNEYLGLGIINTNVKVNEFRKLIDGGFDEGLKGVVGAIETGLAKTGQVGALVGKGLSKTYQNLGIDKAARGAEKFYVAVDDFYKINGYEQELKTLKEAFPKTPENVLRNEASEIIKNTFPNYDRVPPGIKALRELPVGNFISFPAEIVRTSTNILTRASKEITSGNEILRNRGLKRLAGFTVSTGAWAGLSTVGAMALGWDEQQKEGAEILSETPWSKDSPKYFTYIDGDLVSLDTQFIDSYSVIKEPLLSIARELEEGTLRGEELDKRLFNATKESLTVLLKPYVSESMLTDTLTNIYYAYDNPRGVTSTGKQYFSSSQTLADSALAIFVDIASTMSPGFIDSLLAAKDVVTDKVVGGALEPSYRSGFLELLKNTTGLNFKKFNPEESLYYSGKTFNAANKNIISFRPDWSKDSATLLKEHVNSESERFKNYQELYRKYNAGINYFGVSNRAKVNKAFEDAGVPAIDIKFIQAGLFRPLSLSENKAFEMIRKTEDVVGEKNVIDAVNSQIVLMTRAGLNEPLEKQMQSLQEEKISRLGKAKGGVVNIPQAPKEPDQRIDKMTGRPYDLQAGPAFVDIEDRQDPLQRMGFVKGGMVADPLQRLGFGKGGYVIQKGDTLSGIAQETGSSIEELRKLNKIENIDKIYAGKTLNIPEREEEEEVEVEIEPIESVDLPENSKEFSDDVAVAIVNKVFSSDDLETEILETRERATPVIKARIPEIVTKTFKPSPKARKYDIDTLSKAKASAEGTQEVINYLNENVDKSINATVDYFRDIGKKWYESRKDVERRAANGEITTAEEGLWQVAGHINTLTTPVVDLLGLVGRGAWWGAEKIGIDEGLENIGEAVSDTEAVKELIKLMEENPRAARNIESITQVLGVGAAAKVFARGFNRVAEGMRTEQKGFYDTGRTGPGKMWILFKDGVVKVPSATLDAVVPWRSRVRKETGVPVGKMEDELNLDVTPKSRFASSLTTRYIRWQSREKDSGILDSKKSPVALANEYEFLDSWKEADVRKQLFEDVSKGGNLGLRVPEAIQDLASAHVKRVWGKGKKDIDMANTGVVIKRPDGPQGLGREALGQEKQVGFAAVRDILGKGTSNTKSAKTKMIEFINKRNKKEKKPLIKEASDISPEDFKDYLTSRNIKFEEGPGDFVIIKGSHVSAAKEIGGVNNFVAVDTKKGDVFSLISDKHDIGKDRDPIGGRSLLTVQPMVSMNWKTLEIPKYRPRDIAAERAAARKLAKETGVPLRKTQEPALGQVQKTGADRNASGHVNDAVEYQYDVMRALSESKAFSAKDVKDVGRRSSLLAASTGVFRDSTEDVPDEYLKTSDALNALRNLIKNKSERSVSGI